MGMTKKCRIPDEKKRRISLSRPNFGEEEAALADERKMDMNENHLWVSMVLGTIGAAMFLYGTNAGRMVPLGAGLGLLVVPYFIPNVIVMAVVGVAMGALPWIVRES